MPKKHLKKSQEDKLNWQVTEWLPKDELEFATSTLVESGIKYEIRRNRKHLWAVFRVKPTDLADEKPKKQRLPCLKCHKIKWFRPPEHRICGNCKASIHRINTKMIKISHGKMAKEYIEKGGEL